MTERHESDPLFQEAQDQESLEAAEAWAAQADFLTLAGELSEQGITTPVLSPGEKFEEIFSTHIGQMMIGPGSYIGRFNNVVPESDKMAVVGPQYVTKAPLRTDVAVAIFEPEDGDDPDSVSERHIAYRFLYGGSHKGAFQELAVKVNVNGIMQASHRMGMQFEGKLLFYEEDEVAVTAAELQEFIAKTRLVTGLRARQQDS